MQANYLNIHDLVWAITCVECLLIVALLKVLPAKRAQPRKFLSFFFLQVAIVLASNFFIWNVNLQKLAINATVIAPFLLSICLLLQGPTLYFYLRSLPRDIDLRQWQYLIHLVPAIIVGLAILLFDIDGKAWLPWTNLSPSRTAAVKFVWAVVRCLPLFYVLACVWAEYRLRQEIRNHYSTFSSVDMQLSYVILAGFLIHWLWSFVGYFIGGYISAEANDLIGIINNYLTVLLVNVLFVFGLLNSRHMLNLPAESKLHEQRVSEIPDIAEKIKSIEEGIHQQKLYLESHINIDRFAEKIGIRARELSEILNSHYQLNFFEFINGFRVEEAKRLLAVSDRSQETILDIVYKSGFNSQSAFHRFFKRLVGMTPSQYRKLVVDRAKTSSEKSTENGHS